MEYITKDTHLDFSTDDGATYKELYGLNGYPDMGSEPEQKEVTNMRDSNKRYIAGLTDTGNLGFDFYYNKETEEDSGNLVKKAFAALKEQEGKLINWKLNVFDGGSAGTAGMDFTAAVDGANSAQEAFDEAMNAAGDLEDELNNFDLSGLSNTFSTTFSDIGTGFSTLLDAFNFDSDTQLESLQVLDKKVRELFGDDWSDFWTNVGSTMYRAFGENNSEYDRYMALTDIEGWLTEINNFLTGWMGDFGVWWTEVWMNVGAAIAPSIREGLGGFSIEEIASSILTGGMTSVNFSNKAAEIAQEIADSAGNNQTGNSSNHSNHSERTRGVDTSQYQFADYSGIQAGPSFGAGMLSPDELSSRLAQMENGNVINLNLNLQSTLEVDGDKMGESVTNYQTRENAKSNGY